MSAPSLPFSREACGSHDDDDDDDDNNNNNNNKLQFCCHRWQWLFYMYTKYEIVY